MRDISVQSGVLASSEGPVLHKQGAALQEVALLQRKSMIMNTYSCCIGVSFHIEIAWLFSFMPLGMEHATK